MEESDLIGEPLFDVPPLFTLKMVILLVVQIVNELNY